MAPLTPSGEDPLRSLLRLSHQLPAHRFGAVIQEHARMLGALEAVVYLADYEQHRLVAVQDEGAPRRADIPVDGSEGGLAFRRVEPTRSPPPAGGGTRLWVPLLDGAERAGVVELLYPGEVDEATEEEARHFASLLAELAVTRDAYSDVFAKLRRSRPLSVAAEIQWELVPPLTFGSDRIVVTGALEPSYDIGGDTFDYAVNENVADLMVLDAVGHGLPAALLATAAIGAYRAGRRQELPLPAISALVDRVIAEQFPGSKFATAVLARLDLESGRLTWVNAGHPAPLVVRDSSLQPPHPCPSSRPLGLQDGPARECRIDLQPGDRVLLYTDGIVEARSPEGEFFGEERLADFVVRAEAAGDPPPETLRRLMRSVLEHQAGRLQDDASIVLVEWRTGREDQLLL
ncbi:MAG TPA: PP2C family protein-serine/threonine phosphatase [Blastococcus sp.]|nr:PP2C family protein-serine/threonine phosphatase [Blastococcus sp.]